MFPTYDQSSSVQAQEKESAGKKKSPTKRPMMAPMAMMIPGVDSSASNKAFRIARSLRQETRATKSNAKLEMVYSKAIDEFEGLIKKHLDNTKKPKTANFLRQQQVQLYLQAIKKKVPGFGAKLNQLAADLQKSSENGEQAATVVGMTMYFTQVDKMEVGEKAENLVADFLKAHPKKVWSGRVVFLYSMKVLKKNGMKARLEWLEKNLSKVNAADSRNIKRQLVYARLMGKKAELVSKTVSGDPFDMNQLKGKVVLIDFWATWCGPCVREMPEIKEVYQEYKDKGFEVVSFSLDQDREKLEAFLERNEYDWIQLYLDKKEDRDAVSERFGVTGIPATYLVDARGKIVKMNLRGKKKITSAVKKLLEK